VVAALTVRAGFAPRRIEAAREMKSHFIGNGSAKVGTRGDDTVVSFRRIATTNEGQQRRCGRKQQQWKAACCAAVGTLFEVGILELERAPRRLSGAYLDNNIDGIEEKFVRERHPRST
jgi:hypothetical protein